MCGYCTERAALTQIMVESIHDSIPHDPILYPIYLQEANDWRRELASWEPSDYPRGALVALCRHWSERIAERCPAPLADLLDADAYIALEECLALLTPFPEWREAQGIDGLTPGLPSVEQAQAQLDAYVAGWLTPPAADAWDQRKLHEQFLGVSIALDVVAKGAPGDERLQTLAIVSPEQTPFFDALDLWVQRRALRARVASHGVEFIAEHQTEIRAEAILALVIGDQLAKSDLLKLQTALLAAPLRPSELQVDSLLEAVKAKLHRLGTDPS